MKVSKKNIEKDDLNIKYQDLWYELFSQVYPPMFQMWYFTNHFVYSGNKKVGPKYGVFRHYWGKNLCKAHLQKLYDYDVDKIYPGDIPHL